MNIKLSEAKKGVIIEKDFIEELLFLENDTDKEIQIKLPIPKRCFITVLPGHIYSVNAYCNGKIELL